MNLIAVLRLLALIALIPLVLVLAVANALVTAIPRYRHANWAPKLIYNAFKVVFGYTVEVKGWVPTRGPVWYMANHTSVDDFIILGSTLKGSFAGKGEILKWPVVAQLARAVNYIGLRRSRAHNERSIAQLIQRFNAGGDVIMFPEATTTPGDKVYLFRAGLPTLLFGEAGIDEKHRSHTLKREVAVHPVAVEAIYAEVRGGLYPGTPWYSMHKETNWFVRLWKRLKVRHIAIRVTVLPRVKTDWVSKIDTSTPTGRRDASMTLMHHAALAVASRVSPGQTQFPKAHFPGENP